jgi:hypothetical protein
LRAFGDHQLANLKPFGHHKLATQAPRCLYALDLNLVLGTHNQHEAAGLIYLQG